MGTIDRHEDEMQNVRREETLETHAKKLREAHEGEKVDLDIGQGLTKPREEPIQTIIENRTSED